MIEVSIGVNNSLKLATVRIFVIASAAMFIPIPAASFSAISDLDMYLKFSEICEKVLGVRV